MNREGKSICERNCGISSNRQTQASSETTLDSSRKPAYITQPLNLTFRMQPCSTRDGKWELPQGRLHGMEVSGIQSSHGSPPFPLLLSILCSTLYLLLALRTPAWRTCAQACRIKLAERLGCTLELADNPGFTLPPHSGPPHPLSQSWLGL